MGDFVNFAMGLAACLLDLMLLVLVLWRAPASRLVRPVAWLCVAQFVWQSATLMHGQTGSEEWRTVDLAASPWTVPLLLQLIFTFVGQSHAFRWVLRATYLAFGGMACAAIASWWSPMFGALIRSPEWAIFYGTIAACVIPLGGVLLWRHGRQSTDPDEQARTQLLLAAMLIYGAFSVTDLILGVEVHHVSLASVGGILFNGVLATIVLRSRVLGRDLSTDAALFSGVLAIGIGGMVWAGGAFLPESLRPWIVLSTASILAFAILLSFRLRAEWEARARVRELATMGLFARQMAHDLRNPLAALKGAIEWVQHDRSVENLSAESREFLELSVSQARRMESLIQRYQRLGQISPELSPVNLRALLQDMLSLQSAVSPRVQCSLEVEPGISDWSLDSDLVSASIDNLLRNALEAMPEGGALTVHAGQSERQGERGLQLTVVDTGEGMDARTRETAFDDFFTTKDMGQGLGLSFVRRVAVAHGGHTWIENNTPKGTRVAMWFPRKGMAA